MAGMLQDVGIPGRPGPSVQELLRRETRPVPKDAPVPPPAPLHLLGPDETFANAKELGDLGPFFDQDLGNMEWVQKGLRATRKPGVTLAHYQESRIRHFHRTLDLYVSGENGRR